MEGSVKNIANISRSEENKSTTLNISPVIMKRPLANNNPAANNISCSGRLATNISIRNTIAEIRSIAPRILTNTIMNAENMIIYCFCFKTILFLLLST